MSGFSKGKKTHGKDFLVRPVKGGFIIRRYCSQEEVVVSFDEVVTELYGYCFESKFGTQCEVSFKVADWAEGKA